jgi:hypothetical protein
MVTLGLVAFNAVYNFLITVNKIIYFRPLFRYFYLTAIPLLLRGE